MSIKHRPSLARPTKRALKAGVAEIAARSFRNRFNESFKWFAEDALARMAERADRSALGAVTPAKRNGQWLEAFRLYAAAAERARAEDWPDAAWRPWRYRRASLARLLEREGMMQEVAEAYEAVRMHNVQGPPTLWKQASTLYR